MSPKETFNGVEGWELEEMDWDPVTGVSVFYYTRGEETRTVYRPQPVTFKHEGWWERDRTERVLGFTDRDLSRIERGLYNEPVDMEQYWGWL